MSYRVEITARAEAEVREAFEYISADAPGRAQDWRKGLYAVADTLERFPERCGRAPEDDSTEFEVRQLLYGSYRILFTIEKDAVYILHVRHGARRFLSSDQITPP